MPVSLDGLLTVKKLGLRAGCDHLAGRIPVFLISEVIIGQCQYAVYLLCRQIPLCLSEG